MKERSTTHQEPQSAPTSIFRKTKTGEAASASASGLNANFSHVPASGGAVQRAAMEEGSSEGGGVFLTSDALSMLPADVVASLGSALGGEAGDEVKAHGIDKRESEFAKAAPKNPKTARQVFSNDVENPRHIIDPEEFNGKGFDSGQATNSNGPGQEVAGSLRHQDHSAEFDPTGYQ